MSNFRYYRPDSLPPLIKNLIIINALVWVAQITLDRQFQISTKLMLFPLHHDLFSPYQIATYMFAHDPSSFLHLAFNMLNLWLFGRLLENVWGPKRLLLLYFISGVGAAALHLGIQHFRWEQAWDMAMAADLTGNEIQMEKARQLGRSIGPMLGASGAIFGVMAAAALLFPNTIIHLFLFPLPIKWLVLIMVLGDLFGGFSNVRGDNVAHFAHLGGAITGFILVLIWNKTNRKTLY
jgi:membrane associated rhomboid family serine protease